MRNINKLASFLDRAGSFSLADKLDRIARNGLNAFASVNPVGFTSNNPNKKVQTPSSYSVTGQYSDNIHRYKALVEKNDIQGATNYFNAVMRSSFTPQQKGAFRAQAERIRIEAMHGEYANYRPEDRLESDNLIIENLRNYKLQDTNIDKKEFDRRWTNMMLKTMYETMNEGVLAKDNPSWNKQMALTYNMLTQKFST